MGKAIEQVAAEEWADPTRSLVLTGVNQLVDQDVPFVFVRFFDEDSVLGAQPYRFDLAGP